MNLFKYLFSRSYRKQCKYIGLDVHYLRELIEIGEEEIKNSNPNSHYDTFKKGQLSAYRELYESLSSR